jgi:hypothetical protein
LGKFDAKSDVGIFFGYSTSSQASRVYNTRTKVVMESVNIVRDDESTTDQNEGEQDELLKKHIVCSKVVSENIQDTHQVEEEVEEKSAIS